MTDRFGTYLKSSAFATCALSIQHELAPGVPSPLKRTNGLPPKGSWVRIPLHSGGWRSGQTQTSHKPLGKLVRPALVEYHRRLRDARRSVWAGCALTVQAYTLVARKGQSV